MATSFLIDVPLHYSDNDDDDDDGYYPSNKKKEKTGHFRLSGNCLGGHSR